MKIFELSKNDTQESIEERLNLLGINDIPREEQIIVLDEVSKYIFNINQRHSTGKKTFDLVLDYKYYFCDFFDMGINLNTDDIPWWEFDTLLEGIFLKKNSIINQVLEYRLYEKPPKNPKTAEEQEHRFRMKMKQKYALPDENNVDNGLEKLWNYVEKKVGENKEC